MKIVLATVTSLVLATSAFAGDGDRDYKAKFQELDTDMSMTLSPEELATKGVDAQQFAQYDTDGNGVVSEEEFKAMKKDMKDKKDKGEHGEHGDKTYSQ